MKNLFLLLAAVCITLITPVAQSGCQQAPSERVLAVQTLKAVGQSAEAAVALSAQLYAQNRISAAQARSVMDLYTTKFQPAFRVAVSAARADLSSFASPDLIGLAAQLTTLVGQLYTPTP